MSIPQIPSSSQAVPSTRNVIPTSNQFVKSWVTDRHREPLTPDQIDRRNTILSNQEKSIITPRGIGFPRVSFTLLDILNFIFPTVRKMIDEPMCIIGGAASKVMMGLEHSDVDICFYIRKDYFDEIQALVRRFISQQLGMELPNHIIDNNYLENMLCIPGQFSYFGLGKIDLKFILNPNCKRSLTASDGFHIPIYANSDYAYCVNRSHWCDAQNFKLALYLLKTRQFVIDNSVKEDIDDLALRLTHRMTQGFRIESIEDLSSIALDHLNHLYPQKFVPKVFAFQDKLKKHQRNHYSNCKTELTIDLLNFLSFLQFSKKIDGNVSREKTRQEFYKTIASIQKETIPLFALISRNPSYTHDLLAFVKGLFLLEWIKCPEKYPAYIFPFSENERTPRYYIGIPYDDGEKKGIRYLSIDGNPFDVVKQFLLSWRRLEHHFENLKENTTFSSLPQSLGLKWPLLSRETRIEVVRNLSCAFLKPPITTYASLLFKSSFHGHDFYEFLMEESFEGFSSHFLNKQIVVSKLKQVYRSYKTIEPKHESIKRIVTQLEQSEKPLQLENLLEQLKEILHEDFTDQFLLNPTLTDVVKDLILKIIFPAIENSSPEPKILLILQDLICRAGNLNILTDDSFNKMISFIITQSTNELLQHSDYLLGTHRFICQIRNWVLENSPLKKQLDELSLKIKLQALSVAKNLLKDININNEESIAHCLHIAFLSPEHSGLTDACTAFVQYAITTKSGFTLRCAYELGMMQIHKQLCVKDCHYHTLLHLCEQLIGITKSQLEEGQKVNFYRDLGFNLLESLSTSSSDATVQLKIQNRLLKYMATCFVSDHSLGQRESFFRRCLSYFLKLKGFSEAWPQTYQQMEKLKEIEFETSISIILKEFVFVLVSMDIKLALKLMAHPKLSQPPYDKAVYENIILYLLNQNFSTLAYEISEIFPAWLQVKPSDVSCSKKSWGERLLGSINLLKSVHGDLSKCTMIVNSLTVAIRNSKQQTTAWNQLAPELENAIKLLASNKQDRNYLELAKTLQSAAHDCGLFSSQQSNETFLEVAQHKFSRDEHLIETLQAVLKNISENQAEKKLIVVALDLIRQCISTPSEHFYKAALDACTKLLELYSTRVGYSAPYLDSALSSFIIDLIRQMPSYEKFGNEYNDQFIQLIRQLASKNHFASLPDKEAILSAVAKLEKIWRYPEVWQALQMLPLTIEERFPFYLQIVTAAAQNSDSMCLVWLKKEILPQEFDRKNKAKLFPHLFNHVFLITQRISKTETSSYAEFLAMQWAIVLQHTDFYKISDLQYMHDLFIKVMIHVKDSHWCLKACELIIAHPRMSNLSNVISLFNHIVKSEGDKKNIIPKMEKIVVDVLPDYLSKSYDASIDKQIIKLIISLHGKVASPFRYIAYCLLENYLIAWHQKTDSQKGIYPQEMFPLISQIFKTALFTSQYQMANKIDQLANTLDGNKWNDEKKQLSSVLLAANSEALSKVSHNDLESGQNFCKRTRHLLKIMGKEQPQATREHLLKILQHFTNATMLLQWHSELFLLRKCANECDLFTITPPAQSDKASSNALARIKQTKISMANLLIQALRRSYSKEDLEATLIHIDELQNLVNFDQDEDVSVLLDSVSFAHDQILIACILDRQKVNFFRLLLDRMGKIFNQEMSSKSSSSTLILSAKIIRRLMGYQPAFRQTQQSVENYRKYKGDQSSQVELFRWMYSRDDLKKMFKDCFLTLFRDFIIQEPHPDTIFDIMYQFSSDHDFNTAADAGLGNFPHQCLLDFISLLLGSKVIHQETRHYIQTVSCTGDSHILSSLLRVKGFMLGYYQPEFITPYLRQLQDTVREKSPLLDNAWNVAEAEYAKSTTTFLSVFHSQKK